jgi:hypothetical protein
MDAKFEFHRQDTLITRYISQLRKTIAIKESGSVHSLQPSIYPKENPPETIKQLIASTWYEQS